MPRSTAMQPEARAGSAGLMQPSLAPFSTVLRCFRTRRYSHGEEQEARTHKRQGEDQASAKRAKAAYNREARKRAQRTVRRLGAPEDCPVCLEPLARKKDSPVCLVPCGVSAMPSTWNGSKEP